MREIALSFEVSLGLVRRFETVNDMGGSKSGNLSGKHFMCGLSRPYLWFDLISSEVLLYFIVTYLSKVMMSYGC